MQGWPASEVSVMILRVQYQVKLHQVGGGQWRCWESPESMGRGGAGSASFPAWSARFRIALPPPRTGVRAIGSCYPLRGIRHGVRIADGPDFLLRTSASQIESIEFVTPVQAQINYGIGGDTANGVVVVWTRGKGPYASPLRDRD